MAPLTKKKLWVIGGAAGVVILGGAAVFAGVAINNAGQFDQAISEDCSPLVAIAFRGSGEPNLDTEAVSNAGKPYTYGSSALVTNGWEGPTLHGLFDELSRTVYKGEFRADSIPVIPVGPAGESAPFGYDAINATAELSSIDSALTYSKSALLFSAERGAEAATHVIQDYLKKSEGCPILPKFVIVGYSQGAMAARHTAELNRESVLGVVNIGDPYQKPKGTGVRASGSDGTGIIRWKADDTQKAQLDDYYSSPELKSSICHAGDPICEFSPLSGLWKLATGTYGDHLDYYTSEFPDEATTDATAIAKLGYEQWLLAQAAAKAGESVSWADASEAALKNLSLRTVSLAFAGTPTLFSALSPESSALNLEYEFDFNGDGTYESSSPSGTAWTTFDTEGPHTVGVRATDPRTGETGTSQTTIEVAPKQDGELRFDGSDKTVSISAPATVAHGTRMPVTVTGGTPKDATLLPLDGGAWSSAPIPLATSPADWASGILVPASVPAGGYRLIVGVEGDAWGSTAISVVETLPIAAAPPATARPAVTPPAPPVPPVTPPPPGPAVVSFPAAGVFPGEIFEISGTGFTPLSTVGLSPEELGVTTFAGLLTTNEAPFTATTDANGAFRAQLSVSRYSSPGDYVLHVANGATTRDFAFTVNAPGTDRPTFSLLNDALYPGDQFFVVGTGFTAMSAITLSVDELGVIANPSSDSAGNFSATAEFPGDFAPGRHVFWVLDNGITRGYEFYVMLPPG